MRAGSKLGGGGDVRCKLGAPEPNTLADLLRDWPCRALGAELRAAGDSWAAGRADVLSAASGRVRGSLQPAAERLREALRERCSDAAFVPPTDKPAQIAGGRAWLCVGCVQCVVSKHVRAHAPLPPPPQARACMARCFVPCLVSRVAPTCCTAPHAHTGPGLTCTLAGSSCRLVRLAAPTRRDLVLTCTEPAASEALVQPRYTSAYTAGATLTTSVRCRHETR